MKICKTMFTAAVASVLALAVTERGSANDTIAAAQVAVVTAPQANVMRGDQVVGTVHAGQQLTVTQQKQGWLGTTVVVGGEPVGGWVWSGHVASPAAHPQSHHAYKQGYVLPAQPAMPVQVMPSPATRSFAAPRSHGSSRSSTPRYMMQKSNPNRFRTR